MCHVDYHHLDIEMYLRLLLSTYKGGKYVFFQCNNRKLHVQ